MIDPSHQFLIDAGLTEEQLERLIVLENKIRSEDEQEEIRGLYAIIQTKA